MRNLIAIIVGIIGLPAFAFAQQRDTDYDKVIQLPDKFFLRINKVSQTIQDKLDRQSARYLQKIIRREQKISRRLIKTDSMAAHELFDDAVTAYQRLGQSLTPVSGDPPYIPFLDTLHTGLKFLQQNPQLLQHTKDATGKIEESIGHINKLESQLQKAEVINTWLKQRQQYLREKLLHAKLAGEAKKLQKEIFYYGQQVNEYKAMLKQPDKIERKAIDLLSKTELFQGFMRRNSRLASLFRLPGNDDNQLSGVSYASLQTRAQVGDLIQQQIAAGGPNAQQQLQQQIQTAQAELGKLKDKLLRSPFTDGEANMPDFRPNTQKTKNFKQRLELSTNLQSKKASVYFPVTTDLGLSLGYKLNDKSVLGIGASYKVGWGQGWNNINITHQGAGIRSFVDWKIKNSFWFSGGFEYNYQRPANTISTTTGEVQGEVWKRSGLIGISKKYQAGKKFKGRMQLLWDFLSYQQMPRTQSVVFRVGYDLK